MPKYGHIRCKYQIVCDVETQYDLNIGSYRNSNVKWHWICLAKMDLLMLHSTMVAEMEYGGGE